MKLAQQGWTASLSIEVDGAVAAMTVEQRLPALADFDALHPIDHDRVAVTLDEFLDNAIDDRETPGPGREPPPCSALVSLNALDAAHPENRSATGWWRASSRFTQKRLSPTMTGHDDELRLTQMRISGGSVDNGTVEVSVSPVLVSPSPTVMTLTPPNRRRIATFSWAGSRCDAARVVSGNVIANPSS